MTLASFLASQDDAALTAATSKGLVKRAAKDVSAGAVSVVSQDDSQATCEVLGETVRIAPIGLSAAQCSCSAVGPCRHILSAIMVLREGASDLEQPPAAFAFTLSDVEMFAGTDWAQACAVTEHAEVPEAAGSIVVAFPDLDSNVTFPQGTPLKEALYKGPIAAHKRRLVAAAALAILQGQGTALPEVVAEAAAAEVTSDLLNAALEALETAAIALSAGTLAQARDQLFQVAIETRADKAPRLASEMRSLSNLMTEDSLRDVSTTPTEILSRIAKTHALVAALRLAPSDPVLVGQLKRSFTPSGLRSLACLGGESWTTPAGARGLTVYFSDLDSGAIYRTTEARAAGTDLTFQPADRWYAPLWGLAPPNKMAGQRIVLNDALLALDNGLSLSQTARCDGTVTLRDLPRIITDWRQIDTLAVAQIGLGLRRRTGEAHVLLAPDKVSSVGFDERTQAHIWTWFDRAGRAVTLSLEKASGLDQLPKPKAGLVALDRSSGGIRLISLWLDDARPVSLGLEGLPQPKQGLAATLTKVTGRLMPRPINEEPAYSPHLLFFERALEALLQVLLSRSAFPPHLMQEAAALGQSHVCAALDAWQADRSAQAALAAAYVVSLGRDLAAQHQHAA